MAKMDDLKPYMESVHTFEIFRYLSPSELESLIAAATIVEYDADETIITQGDVGRHFYAVVSGSVDVSVQDLGEERFVISHLAAGQFFGEAAIFLREARSATVTTAEPTVVLCIERKDMIDYIRSNPSAGNKILMVIILSLFAKLRAVNQEFVFDKQSDIDYSYVDALVEDFMSRDS